MANVSFWQTYEQVAQRDDQTALRALLGEPSAASVSDVDPRNGESLLAIAARNGALGCVQALLQRGADPDFGGATTPLCAAAEQAQTDVFRALLMAGADPNVPDEIGLPVEAATAADAATVLGLLREVGWFAGATPGQWSRLIGMAAERGFLATARELTLALAATSASKVGRRSLQLLLSLVGGEQEPVVREACEVLGMRLSAAQMTRSEFAEVVSSGIADEVVRQLERLSPKQRRRWAGYAVALAIQRDQIPLAELLMAGDFDPNGRTGWTWGATALMVAVLEGRLDLARRLLAHGADPCATDEQAGGGKVGLREYARWSRRADVDAWVVKVLQDTTH